MQNTIQKFRQSSIVFEKPGILPENLKNQVFCLKFVQLSYSSIFFGKTSPAFSANQRLQNSE